MMGVSHFSAVSSTFNVMNIGALAADKTLTTQEAQDVGILTATPSASKAVIFPKAIEGKLLIVSNGASATYTLTVKVGATGTGVAVAAGKSAILRCTGTDFVSVTADA